MSPLFSSLFAGLIVFGASAFAGDFVLTVNGQKVEVDLDREAPFVLDDGTKLNVKLEQKEYLTFKLNGVQFEYHKSQLPAVSDLGDGVTQTLMSTALGTGILIQTYEGIDPSSLIDLMINELTGEEVNYGYSLEKQKTRRKVGDQVLTGAIATTKNVGEEWIREVVACGNEDKGILIVTFIEGDSTTEDKKVLDRFWKTLQLAGF